MNISKKDVVYIINQKIKTKIKQLKIYKKDLEKDYLREWAEDNIKRLKEEVKRLFESKRKINKYKYFMTEKDLFLDFFIELN